MKSKIIFPMLLILLLSSGAMNNLFAVSAEIKILSDIKEGNGSYDYPFVIDTKEIKYKIEVYGEDKENTLYWPQVHMDGYRSCATQQHFMDLTLEEVHNREFSYTADMAGWYYLRVDLNVNGEGYKMQNFETMMIHVYCRVPTYDYSEPYSPPSWNRKPISIGKILNSVKGTGSFNDPFTLDSPIIKFRIDDSYDPDGVQDLKEGLFLWAIHMKGHHPIYSNGQQVMDAVDTYMSYDEIQGAIYEWDTRDRLSEDGYYMLFVAAIDKHGEKADIPMYFFKYDGDTQSNPILNLSTTLLDLGEQADFGIVTISNIGVNGLTWSATVEGNASWITDISPNQGYIGSGGSNKIQISIDRNSIEEGSNEGTILFESNGGSSRLRVVTSLQVAPMPPQNVTILY